MKTDIATASLIVGAHTDAWATCNGLRIDWQRVIRGGQVEEADALKLKLEYWRGRESALGEVSKLLEIKIDLK